MKISNFADPFKSARESDGVGTMDDQNDPVTMLLRLKDVRKGAHNWNVFRSGATPGRIVIPSEVNIRQTRQIPFEVDPPEHGKYRTLVESWFKRPLEPAYQQRLSEIIGNMIDYATQQDAVEIVSEFALCIQSRALTLLLNIPESEAETWISWGTHVFRSEGDDLDGDKAKILYDYIDEQIDRAIATPSDSLYSILLESQVNGNYLTKEEVKGIMILTFAGGRDTVINIVSNSLAYFAEHPESLARIKAEPEIIPKVIEELVRYFSPLTQMGRVASEQTVACEHAVKADSRISLCWASANRDASVFENPDSIILDRKLNPHVAFGFSHHNCLGATHARQVMKILLQLLAEKVNRIDILDYQEKVESLGKFERKVGFDHINMAFII